MANQLIIQEDEMEFTAVRAQGPGGQNVNKVSSAIHLRFDIAASSLSDSDKQQLLETSDQRITKDGVVIIKAQQFRTQERNRQDAIQRLHEFLENALYRQKMRKPTRPTRGSQQRRLNSKTLRAKTKNLRGRIPDE